MTTETRAAFTGEIRALDDEKRTATVRVVNYNVADTYGSVWEKGVFTDGLRAKLPKISWGHDWLDVIGSATAFREDDTGLDMDLKFADFDAVPSAKRAWSLMKDGHVDEMSFGFKRHESAPVSEEDASNYGEHRATEKISKATMREVSPVLVGSVPGTKVLSVRSGERVSREVAAQLVTRVAGGSMTLYDALRVLNDEEERDGTTTPSESPNPPLESDTPTTTPDDSANPAKDTIDEGTNDPSEYEPKVEDDDFDDEIERAAQAVARRGW